MQWLKKNTKHFLKKCLVLGKGLGSLCIINPTPGVVRVAPSIVCMRAPLMAQLVNNPPPMQETPVQFLGQEDLLEKG